MTTDITELAQRMKAAAVRAKTATEEYASGHMSVSVCYAECEEFNRLTDGPDNILALVEALEKSEKTSEARREAIDRTHNMFVRERDRANAAEEALEKAQTINAAAEKLVRCKGRYHSELNYRALAALFGVTTPDLPPLDGDSRTVTIEPFRSFVTDADLAALHRFAECCDDPESGGHDLEKEQVRRLEAIGALQRSGRISYITGFGDVLISITAGIKWEDE